MEMESIIEELIEITNECREVSAIIDSEEVRNQIQKIDDAIRKIGRASSNSWLGYQSCVYYKGFQIPQPGDHFSTEWGFQSTFVQPVSKNWREYSREDVTDIIFQDAGFSEKDVIIVEKGTELNKFFDTKKTDLLSLFDVILEWSQSGSIEEIRDEVKNLKPYFSKEELILVKQPQGSFMSRDSLAVSQGIVPPPHISVQCWLYSWHSYFTQLIELAKASERATTYLRQKFRYSTNKKEIAQGKIFIGHGQSPIWKDLSYFLKERLRLEWDEFNRESSAGISIKERLESMLDQATFAFLLMTGEDEHTDKTVHARENVIHEVGLFQGRLTFKRAIILLEDGCEEFSNIHGVGQIRFPKGNLQACFEEIRLVLEREGLIPELKS